MDTNSYVIDVQNLNKSFDGKPAVINANLQVKRGEIFGFLGPNGSGKTTTIRMLCGLLTPDSGAGTCLGYNLLTQADEIKYHVGYMTQRFSLYEDLSVEENLYFIAQVYGMENIKELVHDAITQLGLYERRQQLAGTLSGGWKQRLALSAALLHKPQLLLLDEPTAGVDPKARRDFWEQVHQLSFQGITTLVSTHYMDEAERCSRLAYIAYGHILTQGTPDSIVKDSGLTTWELSGIDREDLFVKLSQLPGVEQVASFGNLLHVSGKDGKLLEQQLKTLHADLTHATQISPSLEDVFIHLVKPPEEESLS